MSILILVEGPSDKGVIQKITEKLNVKAKILLMRGNRPNKAIRLIKAALTRKPYSKIIILKDLHKHPEKTIKKNLSKVIKNINHTNIHTIIIKRSIESWILAGMGIPNPENLENPESYLNNILRRKGKQYVKSLKTAKTLTNNINLKTAQQQSQTLNQFIKIIKDP
ncbi:MAG: hypothetical protein NDF55_03680 [archaeon GB-1867-005]|nr:hypothetical protein [Candidatus Culexmicrobium cathedralense]